MRIVLALAGAAFALAFNAAPAAAQSRERIWNLKLGAPLDTLQVDEYVDPACGTNGGPPSTPLGTFANYRRCPVEKTTGLREIWFQYDDEMEYIGKALRDPRVSIKYDQSIIGDHPVIYSLLVDEGGLIQGYRIVTDPREDVRTRVDAHIVGDIFKNIAGDMKLSCTDTPQTPDQEAIEDYFLNQVCEGRSVDRYARIETHHFRKPGQRAVDPVTQQATVGLFESNARLDIISLAVVPK